MTDSGSEARKSTEAQMAMDLLLRVATKMLFLNGVGSQEGLMERMAHGEPSRHRTLLSVPLPGFQNSLHPFQGHPPRASHSQHSFRLHAGLVGGRSPAGRHSQRLRQPVRLRDGLSQTRQSAAISPEPGGVERIGSLDKAGHRGPPPREIGWSSEAQRLWADFYIHWRRSQRVSEFAGGDGVTPTRKFAHSQKSDWTTLY